jgi:hypothetical protein
MKTNQLRIGNYVWDDYSGEMIVSEIHFNPEQEKGLDSVLLRKNMNLPSGRYICSQINPIPLTEEWLWKLNAMSTEMHPANNGIWITCEIDKQGCWVSISHGVGVVVVNVMYVHQLQNIYFALTGVELECK